MAPTEHRLIEDQSRSAKYAFQCGKPGHVVPAVSAIRKVKAQAVRLYRKSKKLIPHTCAEVLRDFYPKVGPSGV